VERKDAEREVSSSKIDVTKPFPRETRETGAREGGSIGGAPERVPNGSFGGLFFARRRTGALLGPDGK